MIRRDLTALIKYQHAMIFLNYSQPLFAMHLLLNPQSVWLSFPSLCISAVVLFGMLNCSLERCQGLTVYSFFYFYKSENDSILVMCALHHENFSMLLLRSRLIQSQIAHSKCFSACRSCNDLPMSDVTGLDSMSDSVPRVQAQATHFNTHIRECRR